MKPQWMGTPTVCSDLAVDGQGPDALGHHRHRLDVAAVRADLDALAGGDADLLRERLADLDELLRLDDRVQARVLGPEMEMLGEPIRGRDVRELRRLAERLAIVRKHARRRIVGRLRLMGIQGVVAERSLERLVVLGERPLGHARARKESRDAFGIHDERPHAAGRILVDLEIRHVRAAPGAAVPADQLARRIVGLAARDRRTRGCRAPGGWRARPRPS